MSTYSAARLLVEARREAGLTQLDLAARTGTPQPVVSAYEKGRREPGAAALSRLAEGLGFRLALVRAPRRNLERMPPDPHRNARVLRQVLDLADYLPRKRRDKLEFPPLLRKSDG